MKNGFLSALYKRRQRGNKFAEVICFYVVDILQTSNQKHSGNDFMELRLNFQFMRTYSKKQILQLMQVFNFSERRSRASQPQAIIRKFKINMAVADADDPFFAQEIPESAFFSKSGVSAMGSISWQSASFTTSLNWAT